MWCGWWLILALLTVGVAFLVAGFGTAVAVNGFPAPIQDMGAASPEELEALYGRPPALAIGLWWAGWMAFGGAIASGVISLGQSTRVAFGRIRCSSRPRPK